MGDIPISTMGPPAKNFLLMPPEEQDKWKTLHKHTVGMWECAQRLPYLTPGFFRYIHRTQQWNDFVLYRRFNTECMYREKKELRKTTELDYPEQCLALARLWYINIPVVERYYLERTQILEDLKKIHGDEAMVNQYQMPTEFSIQHLAFPAELDFYKAWAQSSALICTHCEVPKLFTTVAAFHAHFKTHGILNVYSCQRDRRIFHSRALLEEHKRIGCVGEDIDKEQTSTVWALACVGCGYIFIFNHVNKSEAKKFEELKRVQQVHCFNQMVMVKLITSGSIEEVEKIQWKGATFLPKRTPKGCSPDCDLEKCTATFADDFGKFLAHTNHKHYGKDGIQMLLVNFLEEVLMDQPIIKKDLDVRLYGQDIPAFETSDEDDYQGSYSTFTVCFDSERPLPGVENVCDRICLCRKCYTLTIGTEEAFYHVKKCFPDQEVSARDVAFKSQFVLVIQHHNHLPNDTITCPIKDCVAKCCSVQGIIIHLTMKHGVQIAYEPESLKGSDKSSTVAHSLERASFATMDMNQLCHLTHDGHLPLNKRTMEVARKLTDEELLLEEEKCERRDQRRRENHAQEEQADDDGAVNMVNDEEGSTKQIILEEDVTPVEQEIQEMVIADNLPAMDSMDTAQAVDEALLPQEQEYLTEPTIQMEQSASTSLAEKDKSDAPKRKRGRPCKQLTAKLESRMGQSFVITEAQKAHRAKEAEKMRKHLEEPLPFTFPNNCHDCGFETVDEAALINHLQAHGEWWHGDLDQLRITCYICHTDFNEVPSYYEHLYRQHTKPNPDENTTSPIVCIFCAQSVQLETFVPHLQTDCYNAKYCGMCGVEAATELDGQKKEWKQVQRNKHKNKNHRARMQRFQCDCGEVFSHFAIFERHHCSMSHSLTHISLAENLLIGVKVPKSVVDYYKRKDEDLDSFLAPYSGSTNAGEEMEVEEVDTSLPQEPLPAADDLAPEIFQQHQEQKRVSRISSSGELSRAEIEQLIREVPQNAPSSARGPEPKKARIDNHEFVCPLPPSTLKPNPDAPPPSVICLDLQPSTPVLNPDVVPPSIICLDLQSSTAALNPDLPPASVICLGSQPNPDVPPPSVIFLGTKELGNAGCSHEVPAANRALTCSFDPIALAVAAEEESSDGEVQIVSPEPQHNTDEKTSMDESDDEVIIEEPPLQPKQAPVVMLAADDDKDDELQVVSVEVVRNTVHREKKFKCTMCTSRFCSAPGLEEHVRTLHISDISHLIRLCDTVYGIPLKSPGHFCPTCMVVFEDLETHLRHMNVHRKMRHQLHVCEYCSGIAVSPEMLKKHETVDCHGLAKHGIAGSTVSTEIWCTICQDPSLVFLEDSSYYLHVYQRHQQPIFFFCKNCFFGCCDYYQTVNHIREGKCCEPQLYERTLAFVIATELHFQPIDEAAYKTRDQSQTIKANDCASRTILRNQKKYATCANFNDQNGQICYAMKDYLSFDNELRTKHNYYKSDPLPADLLPKHKFVHPSWNFMNFIQNRFIRGHQMPQYLELETKPVAWQRPLAPPLLPQNPRPPVGRGYLDPDLEKTAQARQQPQQPLQAAQQQASQAPHASAIRQLLQPGPSTSRQQAPLPQPPVTQQPPVLANVQHMNPPNTTGWEFLDHPRLQAQLDECNRYLRYLATAHPHITGTVAQNEFIQKVREITQHMHLIKARMDALAAMPAQVPHWPMITGNQQMQQNMLQGYSNIVNQQAPQQMGMQQQVPPQQSFGPGLLQIQPPLQRPQQQAPQASQAQMRQGNVLRSVPQNFQNTPLRIQLQPTAVQMAAVQAQPAPQQTPELPAASCAICQQSRPLILLVSIPISEKKRMADKLVASLPETIEAPVKEQIMRMMLSYSKICFDHLNPWGVMLASRRDFVVMKPEFLFYKFSESFAPALHSTAYDLLVQIEMLKVKRGTCTQQAFLSILQAGTKCNHARCEVKLKTKAEAQLHAFHSSRDPEIVYLCAICKLQYRNEEEMIHHMHASHPPAQDARQGRPLKFDLTCPAPACNLNYDNPTYLINHLVERHNMKKIPNCNCAFISDRALQDHQHAHTKAGSTQCCLLCGNCKLFEEFSLNDIHSIGHVHRHGFKVSYVCRICFNSCNTHAKLMQHCHLAHNIGGRLPFLCSECQVPVAPTHVSQHISLHHEIQMFNIKPEFKITVPPEFRELIGLPPADDNV